MSDIFLEESYTKYGRETIPKQNTTLWVNIFIICQIQGYPNILKLSSRPFAFTSYKLKKKQKRSGTSLLASFSA